MKRLIPILALLCLAFPVKSQTLHSPILNGSAFPLTITSTTAGDNGYVLIDASVASAAVQFSGGGSFTKKWCDQYTGTSTMCLWFQTSIAGGKTSITCTTCGSIFHIMWIPGTGLSNSINAWDKPVSCNSSIDICWSPGNKLLFNPSYSAELLIGSANCSATGASVTWGGATVTSSNSGVASGEPGGWAIVSGSGTVTMASDAGCGNTGGFIVGIPATGATQTPMGDVGDFGYGAESGSTGTATATANILGTGNLVAVAGWCITTCGMTATVGSDSTTATSVPCVSDANTGTCFIFYDLSNSTAGSQTVTCTPTGTWTHAQCAYMEFLTCAGCTWSHDIDSALGHCTSSCSNPITSPTITATAGDVEYGFTPVQSHTSSVNSPWTGYNYVQSGQTNNQFFVTTINTQIFVLNATGSSTNNGVSQLTAADPWQGVLTSFKITGASTSVVRHRAWVIQ